jgi:hypothetical protein
MKLYYCSEDPSQNYAEVVNELTEEEVDIVMNSYIKVEFTDKILVLEKLINKVSNYTNRRYDEWAVKPQRWSDENNEVLCLYQSDDPSEIVIKYAEDCPYNRKLYNPRSFDEFLEILHPLSRPKSARKV